MDNRQAIGYLLLACKKLGYTKEQTEKLFNEMCSQFDLRTEWEAEEMGFNWFYSLPE